METTMTGSTCINTKFYTAHELIASFIESNEAYPHQVIQRYISSSGDFSFCRIRLQGCERDLIATAHVTEYYKNSHEQGFVSRPMLQTRGPHFTEDHRSGATIEYHKYNSFADISESTELHLCRALQTSLFDDQVIAYISLCGNLSSSLSHSDHGLQRSSVNISTEEVQIPTTCHKLTIFPPKDDTQEFIDPSTTPSTVDDCFSPKLDCPGSKSFGNYRKESPGLKKEDVDSCSYESCTNSSNARTVWRNPSPLYHLARALSAQKLAIAYVCNEGVSMKSAILVHLLGRIIIDSQTASSTHTNPLISGFASMELSSPAGLWRSILRFTCSSLYSRKNQIFHQPATDSLIVNSHNRYLSEVKGVDDGVSRGTDPRDLIECIMDIRSFVESYTDYGRGVITGRARLHDLSVGIIATETRPTANLYNGKMEPGMLWQPHSARKTAKAVKDFISENLDGLIVFATWRGFSGGMKDMFNAMLKEGSLIVDVLSTNPSLPIIIYLPPHSEIRGGAWVVLDSQVNMHKNITISCDPSARINILEPVAFCKVKMRPHIELKRLLARHRAEDGFSVDVDENNMEIKKYTQVGLKFADLHDTPERAMVKGCVDDVVDFRDLKAYFYSKIMETKSTIDLRRKIANNLPNLSSTEIIAIVSHLKRTTRMAEVATNVSTDLEDVTKKSGKCNIGFKLESTGATSPFNEISDLPLYSLKGVKPIVCERLVLLVKKLNRESHEIILNRYINGFK